MDGPIACRSPGDDEDLTGFYRETPSGAAYNGPAITSDAAEETKTPRTGPRQNRTLQRRVNDEWRRTEQISIKTTHHRQH